MKPWQPLLHYLPVIIILTMGAAALGYGIGANLLTTPSPQITTTTTTTTTTSTSVSTTTVTPPANTVTSTTTATSATTATLTTTVTPAPNNVTTTTTTTTTATLSTTVIVTTATTTTLVSTTIQTGQPNQLQVDVRGVRLIFAYSSLDLKVGDRLDYSVELRNVNSSSRLSWLQSSGQIWFEIYNESGSIMWQSYGVYATGPTGPQRESFLKGYSWVVENYLYVDEKLQNARSVKLDPGKYSLVVRAKYYNLDLEAGEEISLKTTLNIAGT